MRINRRTRVAVEAVVSAVVLGAAAALGRAARGGEDSARHRPRWFVPAVVVSVATVPMMALRWQLLLEAKHVSVPLGWLTRTYFVALFAGQFLPAAIGGDAVRVVELGRRTGDAPEAVASVLIDRLVGLVSLVVLAIVAVLVSGGGRRPGVIAAEAAFGAAAAVALLLLFSSRLRGAVARWLEPRAAGRRLAVGGRFYEALHAYRSHRGARRRGASGAARAGGAGRRDLDAGPGARPRRARLRGAAGRPGRVRRAGAARLVERDRRARGRVRLLPARLCDPAEAIALGLAFFAVGTVTALGGAAVLVVRFIRYGVGAVRPRTGIGDPPGAKGD